MFWCVLFFGTIDKEVGHLVVLHCMVYTIVVLGGWQATLIQIVYTGNLSPLAPDSSRLAFRTNGKNFLCHREICSLGLYNLIQENCTRKQGFHLFDSILCWALLTFAWIALAWAKPRDSFVFRSSSNTTASSHFLIPFGAAACETSSAEAMSFLKSTVWVVFSC